MKTQTIILLLRGINVSGQKLIRMEDLRKAFADAGFDDVRTYIQSGNVVAKDSGTPYAAARRSTQLIADAFGFDVAVMAVLPSELKEALLANPFDGPGNKVYLVFLSAVPAAANAYAWESLDFGHDRTRLQGRVLYVQYCDGAGQSKLTTNLMEKKLGVRATARNLNTCRKLLEMTSQAG